SVLPLLLLDHHLVVGVPTRPSQEIENRRALDEISGMTGMPTLAWPLPPEYLAKACQHFHDPRSLRIAISRAMEGRPTEANARQSESLTPSDAPVIDLVNQVLEQALELGA